jgi:hypothetical protein
MHTVHVRVNDAATGKPTPCRIRFTDAEGRYYAPFGRLTDFATVGSWEVGGNVQAGGNLLTESKRYAYIDGACEIPLPAGRITVEIHKGLEYNAIREEIQLARGKLALRFNLKRWTNTREAGWYSGDVEAYRLSPDAALLEGTAEDLAVVNLLAEEAYHRYEDEPLEHFLSNILAFSGQQPALERPHCMVVVNTANGHGVLGNLGLLNCHRPVYPLSFGYTPLCEGLDDWTLADWCDQCHRKGGLVVGQKFCASVFFPREHGSYPWSGETLADLILGKIDAIDVKPVGPPWLVPDPLREWRVLLNAGFRIPLVGGSGKSDNAQLLGAWRTYALVEATQEWTYKNWIEAVRAGRTFVTNGPILSFAVNGHGPGAILDLTSACRRVHVRAEARSLQALEALEVMVNGAVVASAQPTGENPSMALLESELDVPGPGWLAARAVCTNEPNEVQPVYAHTSAVYVRLDGRPPSANSAEIDPFLAKLDKMLEWVAREARCETDQQRQRLAAVFESAKQELLRRQSA